MPNGPAGPSNQQHQQPQQQQQPGVQVTKGPQNTNYQQQQPPAQHYYVCQPLPVAPGVKQEPMVVLADLQPQQHQQQQQQIQQQQQCATSQVNQAVEPGKGVKRPYHELVAVQQPQQQPVPADRSLAANGNVADAAHLYHHHHQPTALEIAGDDLDDDDDDEDDGGAFNHELVLSKILNEKKLALSYSPDVIRFLNNLPRNVPKH